MRDFSIPCAILQSLQVGFLTLRSRHETPPVVLSLPDLLSRFQRRTAEEWRGLSWSQTQLLKVARRTLFELRAEGATRRAAS